MTNLPPGEIARPHRVAIGKVTERKGYTDHRESAVRKGKVGGIPLDEPHRSVEPRRTCLASGFLQHGPGEVQADHPWLTPRHLYNLKSQIAGTAAKIEHIARRGAEALPGRSPPPYHVEAACQQAVQQIVPPGDCGEHASQRLWTPARRLRAGDSIRFHRLASGNHTEI
jgi:hypothetical protein